MCLHVGHIRPSLSEASRLCLWLALAFACSPCLIPACALRSEAVSGAHVPLFLFGPVFVVDVFVCHWRARLCPSLFRNKPAKPESPNGAPGVVKRSERRRRRNMSCVLLVPSPHNTSASISPQDLKGAKAKSVGVAYGTAVHPTSASTGGPEKGSIS